MASCSRAVLCKTQESRQIPAESRHCCRSEPVQLKGSFGGDITELAEGKRAGAGDDERRGADAATGFFAVPRQRDPSSISSRMLPISQGREK